MFSLNLPLALSLSRSDRFHSIVFRFLEAFGFYGVLCVCSSFHRVRFAIHLKFYQIVSTTRTHKSIFLVFQWILVWTLHKTWKKILLWKKFKTRPVLPATFFPCSESNRQTHMYLNNEPHAAQVKQWIFSWLNRLKPKPCGWHLVFAFLFTYLGTFPSHKSVVITVMTKSAWTTFK